MLSGTYTYLSSIMGYSQDQLLGEEPVKPKWVTVQDTKEKVEFDKWLDDPQIFSVNRNSPHAPLRSFPSVEIASRAILENMGVNGGGLMRLNSEWRYKQFSSVKQLPPDYATMGFNDAAWDKVGLPHSREKNIPSDSNPLCVYRYWFYVPQDSLNKQSSINFEGVGGALMVWINDQFMGYSEEGSLPQDFTITSSLKEGYNLLVAVVSLKSTGSVIEAKRSSRVFGIYGDVSILFKPQVHIVDYAVNPKVTVGKGTTVELDVDVRVSAASQELIKDATMELHLLGMDQQYVLKPSSSNLEIISSVEDNHNKTADFSSKSFKDAPELPQNRADIEVPNKISNNGYVLVSNSRSCQAYVQYKVDVSGQGINLWSAETPTFYGAILVLKDSEGEIIECEGCQVGFRSVEIIKRELCVNGIPVQIRGIEFDPDLSNEESMIRDIQIIKQHNFNAVLTALHSTRWLELCNQMGVYVVDTADLQSSSNEGEPTYVMNRPEWLYPFMSRGVRMLHSHRNNPSIILWSLGYESGFSAAHSALAGYLGHIDPQRNLYYPGAGGITSATDIICPQLKNYEELLEMVKDPAFNRPIIISRFFQKAGNTCGGLKDLWDIVQQYPMLQGGFLSLDNLFLGSEVIHPALIEAKTLFKPIDFAWSMQTLQAFEKDAKMAKFKYQFQIAVRNNEKLAPISNLKILWRVAINGHIADFDGKYDLGTGMDGWGETSQLQSMIQPGSFDHVTLPIKPMELLQEISKYGWRSIEVVLELRALTDEGTEVIPAGHILAEHQLVVPHTFLDCAARYVMALASFQDDLEDPHVFFTSKVSCAPLSVEEAEDAWFVKGSGLQVKISKTSGGIVNLDYGEMHGCVRGLEPCFVRMPTQQDQKEIQGNSYAKIWKEAGLDWLSIEDEIQVKLLSADNLRVNLEVSYTLKNMPPVPLSMMENKTEEINQQEQVELPAGDINETPAPAPAPSKSKIEIKIIYHILHSGVILMDCMFNTKEAINFDVIAPFIKSLPRVGLQFSFAEDMNQLQYYGRGAHENYPDRKVSALLRRYNQSVEQMQSHYPEQQESGGRCDVRCVLLTNDNGQGLGIFDADAYGSRAFQMSVSNGSTPTLDQDNDESMADGNIHLYMDHKHMGVGGTTNAMSKYCVPPDGYNFTVGMVPYIGLSTPDKAMEMLIGTWRQNMLRK